MSWRIGLGLTSLLVSFLAGGVAAAQSGTQDADGLSQRQKTQFIDDTVDEINNHVSDVLDLIQNAETEGDALLLDCLNPKLAGLQALYTVVVSANAVYDEALVRGNDDLAKSEYGKVDMAKRQADTLKMNADACVPASGTSFSGQGRWSTTGPEGDEDDSQYESDPSGYTRPPEASPFS